MTRRAAPSEGTWRAARPSRSCELIALTGAAASLLCLDAALAPTAAQQSWDATIAPIAREDAKRDRVPAYMRRKWSPTVMTTEGGEVADRVALGAIPPVAKASEIERFAAPQLMGAEPVPSLSAGWSSIVTGALGPEASPVGPDSPAKDPPLRKVQAEPAPGQPAVAPNPGSEVEPAAPQLADPPPKDDATGSQPVPKAPSPRSPTTAPPESTTAEQHAPAPVAAPSATANSARGAGAAPEVQPPAPAQAPAQQTAPAQLPAKPFEALPPDARPAQQYCYNIADPAADARAAFQAKKIKEMDEALDKRVVELDAKIEELKTWLARRDDFSKRAQEKLVGFYTRMRPDASALQLAAMDEETAAAVLTKLEPKVASAVMNEMTPERAARLASIISGASKVPRSKVPQAVAAPVPAKSSGEGNAAPPPARTKS